MKTRPILGSILFLLIIFLAGCRMPGEATPTDIFASPIESPLATIKATSVTPSIELPTPVDNMATVGGTLYLDANGEPLRPLANVRIFLGTVHVSEDGTRRLAGYSEHTSPQSVTDAEGRFVIYAVPPDTYNLVVVRYLDPVFMTDYKTGKSLVFTLEADDVLDLGEIHYMAEE